MFIVIELQKTSDDSVANIVTSYANQNEAESKYHDILRAAAISPVLVHSAMIVTEEGFVLKSEYYEHKPEASS